MKRAAFPSTTLVLRTVGIPKPAGPVKAEPLKRTEAWQTLSTVCTSPRSGGQKCRPKLSETEWSVLK